jgi:hypothetical protein
MRDHENSEVAEILILLEHAPNGVRQFTHYHGPHRLLFLR